MEQSVQPEKKKKSITRKKKDESEEEDVNVEDIKVKSLEDVEDDKKEIPVKNMRVKSLEDVEDDGGTPKNTNEEKKPKKAKPKKDTSGGVEEKKKPKPKNVQEKISEGEIDSYMLRKKKSSAEKDKINPLYILGGLAVAWYFIQGRNMMQQS